MKTFTPEELKKVLAQHKLWLDTNHEQGARANLYGANLSYANLTRADLTRANLSCANLSCANLSCADLYGANLIDANLSCANLSYADLSCANLTRAKLSYANLTGADLSYANLPNAASIKGCIGNMMHIKSIQADYWPITYTATHMQIGCQLHLITKWWAFSKEEIYAMDEHAHAWWKIWKLILKKVIAASPAKPTGYEEV